MVLRMTKCTFKWKKKSNNDSSRRFHAPFGGSVWPCSRAFTQRTRNTWACSDHTPGCAGHVQLMPTVNSVCNTANAAAWRAASCMSESHFVHAWPKNYCKLPGNASVSPSEVTVENNPKKTIVFQNHRNQLTWTLKHQKCTIMRLKTPEIPWFSFNSDTTLHTECLLTARPIPLDPAISTYHTYLEDWRQSGTNFFGWDASSVIEVASAVFHTKGKPAAHLRTTWIQRKFIVAPLAPWAQSVLACFWRTLRQSWVQHSTSNLPQQRSAVYLVIFRIPTSKSGNASALPLFFASDERDFGSVKLGRTGADLNACLHTMDSAEAALRQQCSCLCVDAGFLLQWSCV